MVSNFKSEILIAESKEKLVRVAFGTSSFSPDDSFSGNLSLVLSGFLRLNFLLPSIQTKAFSSFDQLSLNPELSFFCS